MQYFKEYIDECKIIVNNNYIEGIFNIIDDKNSVIIHQNNNLHYQTQILDEEFD